MRKSVVIVAVFLAFVALAATTRLLWNLNAQNPEVGGVLPTVARQTAAEPAVTIEPTPTASPSVPESEHVDAATAKGPRFEELAQKSGAMFSHARAQFDPKAKPLMPWLTAGGAGVAVADFDRDGLDDIYVVTSLMNSPNALFRNKGGFEFEDVAPQLGLADVNTVETGTSSQPFWFDFDGDGWLDLLLLRFGQLSLYRNLEGHGFEDKAEEAGIAHLLNTMAAAAFDYDRDGDIDLYIGGYFPEKDFNNLPDTKVLFESWETARNGGPNYFYRNNGDGTFTDVTEAAGVADKGWTMAVGHGDLDNDGWQDLYLANDFGADTVFRNRGDGTFENVTRAAIGVDTKKGMNAEFADYNNDGFLDVYVTNMTEPYLHECNMLWENHGNFKFSDVATETGACDTDWGWGAKFFDADNDGLQDLYVANGFISSGSEDYMHKLLEFVFKENIDLTDAKIWPDMAGYSMAGYEHNVFLHQKFGSFVSEGATAGVDDTGDGRGVAVADFDRDGRVDFVVTNVAGPMRVYRNVTEDTGHWIGFVLKQESANPDALGARIVLETDTDRLTREVAFANGFNAQSMLGAHFGLGPVERINRMTVTWPDGNQENLEPPTPGAWYLVERGKGISPLAAPAEQKDEKSPTGDTNRESGSERGAAFVDVAREAGIAKPHVPAVFDPKLGHIMDMIAAGAAGGAVGDYDRDGDLDIFVNNAKAGEPNYLWRNEGNMRFVDMAQSAGLADLNRAHSTSAGGIFLDYDGDGWKDLLVFQMGVCRLMRNQGDGSFEDVTEKAGLGKVYRNTLSAIAFDAERDGDVDLYLGAYFPDRDLFELKDDKVLHDSWETSRNGGSNVFFRNNGDGTFSEATEASGLADAGWTMAVGHADVDNDGWQDVYVANDYGTDALFLNNKDGTFRNVTRDALGIDTKKGMNADFGDMDGDGFLDIYVTNVTEQFLHECNVLWRNNGSGTFTDISQEMGACDAGWAWGAKFFDLENDGDLDLYVANGFFKGEKGDYLDILLPALWNNEGENPSAASKWPPLMGRGIAQKERNVLFVNESGTGFKRQPESPLAIASESRGIFTGDFDNDGRMDLFVTNNDDTPNLFHNQTDTDNAWLELELIGRAPNTDAVGARATIMTFMGPLVREVNIGNGFAGGSSGRLHFGLGKLEKVDEIKIRWPDGETTTVANPELNRILRIEQPAKSNPVEAAVPAAPKAPANPAFRDVTESSGLVFRHYGPKVDEKLRNLGPWFTALGAGGSVGDVNNDGLLDLYFTNSLRNVPNALFINKGGMKFEEAAVRYGAADLNQPPNFSMMSLFVDLDQDGWDDLVVVRFGKSLILRNVKGERFEPVEDALAGAPFPRNPVAVVAFDYDKDGDLDLYFGSYFPDVDLTDVGGRTNLLHDSWEAARNGGSNFLLENQGNFHFVDRTKIAGLEETGWSLAIGTGDINKDGWIDLYVANDFGADRVYHNNGNGSFTDVSTETIGVDTKKGMNAELGDFDNDGFLDVYVTNITEPYLHECNMLWRNNGDGSFSDVSTALGTCDTRWGWGAKFIDYDNDGFQDLYVQNGFISGGKKDYIDILMPIMLDSEVNLSDTMNWPPLGEMSFSGYEKKVLFHNIKGSSFEEVSAANGVDNERDGRGLIVADLDNDGDVDMVTLNANQNAILYENVYPNPGSQISIELEGTKSNRGGFGTRITAYTPEGLFYRETNAGNGFQSQSTPLVHIGVGGAKKIDEMEVIWPSGEHKTFIDVAVDQRYFLKEGEDLQPWKPRNARRVEEKPAEVPPAADPAPAKSEAKSAGTIFEQNPEQSDPAKELQRLRNEGIAKYESGLALDDALKAFERAFEISHAAADAFNVAVVYFKKNDNAGTRKWLEESLRPDADFANAHYLMGVLARSEGNTAEEKQHWERARELAPDDAYVHYQLALLARSEGDEQSFLQSLVNALGLEPDNSSALYQMYRYYQTSGNKELAEKTLAKFNALKKQEKFSRREKQKDPGKLAQPVLAESAKGFEAIPVKPVYAASEIKLGCNALAAEGYVTLVDQKAIESIAVACAEGKLLRVDAGRSEFSNIGVLPSDPRDIRVEWFDEKGPRVLALTGNGLYLGSGLVGESSDYTELSAKASAPLALADMDADGDIDIALGGGETPLTNAGKLKFIREDGLYKDGALSRGMNGAKSVAMADIQRDGLADFLVLRNDALVVLVGSPSGYRESLRLPVKGEANGLVVGDFSNDGILDVAVLMPGALRLIWNLDLRAEPNTPVTQELKPGVVSIRLARSTDYNNDGLLDLLLIAADGQAALLSNQGQRRFQTESLGRWNKPAVGARLLAADFDTDGREDLAYVSAEGTLALAYNATEGGGSSLALFANGVRAAPSGLLTQIEVRRGANYAYVQSSAGVQHIGIGRRGYVEVLRIEWTNGFIENKLKVDASMTPRIFKESERISGSCPSLFVWNGEKFEYFTDMFISGPMGVPLDRGVYFPVRDRELLAIPGDRVQLRDGRLDLRFTEELHESVFLDRARLIVVDHSEGTEVYPHSRLAPVPPPAEPFYTVGGLVSPARATGSDGSDLTAVLTQLDQHYADFFPRSQNAGFAEPHWIDVDLPENVDPSDVDSLLATGWFFYFESTSMIANAQSKGPDLPWPWLQQWVDGSWQDVAPVGVPSGKDKTALVPLHGKLTSRRLRIHSGISTYWDRIAFGLKSGVRQAKTSDTTLADADLRFHGFSELTARDPERFDYHSVNYASLWSPMQGRFTAYGPVESLVQAADGRYALFGSGDEIALSFRVDQPKPPAGWTRTYMLELVGYVKDGDRYTAHAGRVEPVPYLGLDRYPAPDDERLREAQTRSPNRTRAPLDFTLVQTRPGY